ncbi:MAG: carbohydrate binding family 9 domain-containing protein, partial [Flavobacterium sp.]
MKKFVFLVVILLFYNSFSQKKTLQASKINQSITIDGLLDEVQWANTDVAKDFVMFEPDNGIPENKDKKTEVKILYDHTAIYIGAILYDNQPETIMREIAPRDELGSSDFFGVFLNGYNDGQQEYRFFVTAAGVQLECSATETDGEDFTWNAIWESEVKISNHGWTVEMKIPYAALRFPPKNTQNWGINFIREVRNQRFKYTWTFINRKLGNIMPQAGILEGIENIKTPTRLFLIP